MSEWSEEELAAAAYNHKYGFTKPLGIARSVSAIVSTIASSILIRMLMKSNDRATTTSYHRLMLGLSISDILNSMSAVTFNAITPSELSYLVWNARGNQGTCDAQGFLTVTGAISGVLYYCSLNLYYLAKVKYYKTDKYISSKLERYFHAVPIGIALTFSITFLAMHKYNGSWVGNCSVTPVYEPPHCSGYEDGEVPEGFEIPCGRGRGGETFWHLSRLVTFVISPIVVCTSLGMIFRFVHKMESRISRFHGAGAGNNNTQNTPDSAAEDRRLSRSVLYRALAYSTAYFLTWGWPILASILLLAGVWEPLTIPTVYVYFWSIFSYLQGLFNLLIYMYPHVKSAKRSSEENISWCHAFAKVFWSSVAGGKEETHETVVPPTVENGVMRRTNINPQKLTMGLNESSANLIDWMMQAKIKEWLKSLSHRDPRACIRSFFNDVARDGAGTIEEEDGFHPELISPLVSMFQRSSVFSVWRPTSMDSIRRMMMGEGTGKGLDIKGKSAKKGKLSAYVPFMQIHEEEHKRDIHTLPRDGRIRIFYRKREMRDSAHEILQEVMRDMMEASSIAIASLRNSNKVPQDNVENFEKVLASFSGLSAKGIASKTEEEEIRIVNEWEMDHPSIEVVDDYSPKCFGLDLPKRLFWEGYVMRAKDISRKPGSTYETGRASLASFQDMNFASIKNESECDADQPRAVVWQYTDPYLPPTEPDPDPMMPQTLLMAYEEHGRVMPVVSDFDGFLLGTRGVRFHNPLPDEQVELVHDMVTDIEQILKDCSEGKNKSSNWTASWLDVMKNHKKHITLPKYGFGDPKSYAIMKHAVQRLEDSGAVRHGAECFNFYFPQELDEEFLVIGGNLGGAKYKYMKLSELQDFLSGCIDLGFTFPLNPKWILCDEGWKALWDKLRGSTHPNAQLSINAWYPPGSGLKERIEDIQRKYPEGFHTNLSGRKTGTQSWDEAEFLLDKHQRIQRAKRKLLIVLLWISVVQQSWKKIQSQKGSEAERELSVEEVGVGEEMAVAGSAPTTHVSSDVPITEMVDERVHQLQATDVAQDASYSDFLDYIVSPSPPA